jgi:hypothetical protein
MVPKKLERQKYRKVLPMLKSFQLEFDQGVDLPVYIDDQVR